MDKLIMSEIILDYLKVILTWPVIFGSALFYFLVVYRDPIQGFLRRIIKGKIYGATFEASPPIDQDSIKDKKSDIEPLDEMRKFVKENPEKVMSDYFLLANHYRFERSFHFIYGTQILLLEHLEKKGVAGDYFTNLLPFYQQHITLSQSDSYKMEDYVDFLSYSRFVEYNRDDNKFIIKITDFGLDFLNYLRSSYKKIYLNRAY